MKMEIVDKKEYRLLNKVVYKARFSHEGPTPSRQEIKDMAIQELKGEKDRVIVNKVFTVKGKTESLAKVSVYDKMENVPKNLLKVSSGRETGKKDKSAPVTKNEEK